MGYIHSLESFGSVDGPGIRFLIFFTGCRMRCRFCHNPDTWELEKGAQYTADELLDRAERYRSYWGDEGGITASGGEPLVQMDFLLELFRKAKQRGIHTCLDTSAQPFTRGEPFFGKFRELMACTDLVLLDIKDIREDAHIALTGHTNANILDCARYLSETGKPVWIRHVLVSGGPSTSDDDGQLAGLSAFLDTLRNVERIEVLPYHTFGVHKWDLLGIPYPYADAVPPTQERIENAKQILGYYKRK